MVDKWEEATSGDVIKLNEGERVEGTLVSCEPSTQFPDSYAVSIDTKEGNKVLFVNNIVRDLIDKNSIMSGQKIAIVFKGMKKNQAGTREYKDYSVLFVK